MAVDVHNAKLSCATVIRVGESSADVVDKEVTSMADLSDGDVRRGYVVSAGSVGVLVRSAAVCNRSANMAISAIHPSGVGK